MIYIVIAAIGGACVGVCATSLLRFGILDAVKKQHELEWRNCQEKLKGFNEKFAEYLEKFAEYLNETEERHK